MHVLSATIDSYVLVVTVQEVTGELKIWTISKVNQEWLSKLQYSCDLDVAVTCASLRPLERAQRVSQVRRSASQNSMKRVVNASELIEEEYQFDKAALDAPRGN